MTEATNDRGLCTTCDHAATCRFVRDQRRPVFYCEEFRVQSAPEVAAPDAVGRVPATGSEYEARPAPGARTWSGLCVNCAVRDSCSFPQPDGGVWHCEEYR